MLTRFKNMFSGSATYKLINLFFLDQKEYFFADSKLGFYLTKIKNKIWLQAFLVMGLIIILYKSLLQRVISPNLLSFLPLVFLFLAFLFADKSKLKIRKWLIWYLLFLTVSMLSAVLAVFKIGGFYIFQGWLFFAQFALVIFLGQQIGKKVIPLVLLTSLPMSLYAISQMFSKSITPKTWFSAGEAASTRVFGFLGSPNVLGVLMCCLVISAIGQYLVTRRNVYLAIAAINMVVVFLTLSRTSWLGLIIGISCFVFFLKPKLLFLSPIILLFSFISQIRNRILFAFSSSYLYDSSLDGRIWAWINGLYIFKRHSIFGTGPGTYGGQLAINNASPVYLQGIQNGYTALYFTDNQILEILVQTGAMGFIAFTFFCISLFIELIRKFEQKKDIISLTAASVFLALVAAGLFANVLEFGAVAIPVGLIIGAGLNE